MLTISSPSEQLSGLPSYAAPNCLNDNGYLKSFPLKNEIRICPHFLWLLLPRTANHRRRSSLCPCPGVWAWWISDGKSLEMDIRCKKSRIHRRAQVNLRNIIIILSVSSQRLCNYVLLCTIKELSSCKIITLTSAKIWIILIIHLWIDYLHRMYIHWMSTLYNIIWSV